MLLRGRTFAALCQDLFTLSQVPLGERGPRAGWRWEGRVADYLARKGYPAEAVPGGVQVYGVLPASGLRHQTDAVVDCTDAHVIGELKAHQAAVPKNEVLRFKAATDDIYDSLVELRPRMPVLRLFGIAGNASPELRWYAARHGICLVERSRWPAPVIADPGLPWRDDAGPSAVDRERLEWLSRPLQEVYPRLPDGSLRLPRRLPNAAVQALLDIHDLWSDRLWDLVESDAGRFEEYVEALSA
jgi:hypothetical protein